MWHYIEYLFQFGCCEPIILHGEPGRSPCNIGEPGRLSMQQAPPG